jgi:hypothetical protein
MAPHFDSATSGNAAGAPPQPQGTEYHPAVAGGITSISGVQALHDAAGTLPSGEQLLPNAGSGLPQSQQQAGFLSAGGMSADVSNNDEMATGPTPQNTPLIGAVARPPVELGATDMQQDDSAKPLTTEGGVKPLAAAAAPAAPSGDPKEITPAAAAVANALPNKMEAKLRKAEHKEHRHRTHIAHKAQRKLERMHSKEEKTRHKLRRNEYSKPTVVGAAPAHQHRSTQVAGGVAGTPLASDKHFNTPGTAETALPAAPIEQQRDGDHAFGNEARLPEREQPHSANAVGDKPGQQPITFASGAFGSQKQVALPAVGQQNINTLRG